MTIRDNVRLAALSDLCTGVLCGSLTCMVTVRSEEPGTQPGTTQSWSQLSMAARAEPFKFPSSHGDGYAL